MSANSRLHKELLRIKKEKVPGIYITSGIDSVRVWQAQIEGPEGSPYEGGLFEMTMSYPKDYPFKPPVVRFTTKVFHPNVYTNGDICLDILQNAWQPTYTGEKVLLSIQSLLTDPNPASSANGRAGSLYEKDRRSYEAEAKKMTQKYAMSEESKKRKMEADAAYSQPKSQPDPEPPKKKQRKGSVAEKPAEPAKPVEPVESEPPKKSAEEILIEELHAEGYKNTTLLRQLLPIVAGDRALLKSLYDGQNA
eukprot:TRINITY_DN21010_c0_g1_i1.p1 TRINITY_DN21010_c0_g1~~TRINITY_DN21010_c0_g1_i1.p1  ORF type:complete len:271 (+),score=76.71 TRINITY_DN21010_c0_g1_i1:65-814(+)